MKNDNLRTDEPVLIVLTKYDIRMTKYERQFAVFYIQLLYSFDIYFNTKNHMILASIMKPHCFFIIDPTYRLLQYRLFAHTTLNNHWMCSSIQPGCKALDKTPMRLNRQIIQTGSKSLRTHRDKCPIANTDWKSSKRSTTKVIFSLVGHGGGHLRRGEEAPPVLTIVHMCTRW